MRVDKLYRTTIRAELAQLGVPVVNVPARCLDEDGFTLAEFGQLDDPHHGNAPYGAVMMGEVLMHLSPSRTNTAVPQHLRQAIP